MEKILLKIIKYGVCLSLFTPLVISPDFFFPYVGPKSIYFLALAQIVFFSYLILAVKNSKYRPKLNILLIALSCLLLVLILSSVFGVDFQKSFWSKYERMTGLLMWFHLFAFFIVLSSVFKKKADWLLFFGVSVFGAVIAGIIALFALSGVELIGSSSRSGATLGNSSFLGAYLLFNFFFAVYLFFETNKEKIKNKFNKAFNFYALLSIGMISLSLYFSTARAALISTIGGAVLIFLLWLVFTRKNALKYIGIVFLSVGIIGAVAAVFLTVFSTDMVEKKFIDKFGSSSMKPRFEVARMSIEGLKERPLLGWGMGNFGLTFTKHFNPKFFTEEFGNDIWYDKAHNIVFDTLNSSGVLGFLAYLFVFAAVFWILWKNFLKKKIGFWAASIFSVVLVSYFIQNLTVFDMVSSYLMLSLVLGFVGSACNKETDDSYKKGNWQIPIILILFIACFISFVIQPLRADRSVIKAVSATPFSEERLSLYKKTLELSPIGSDQIKEFFADSSLSYLEKYIKESSELSEELKDDVEKRIKKEIDFISSQLEESVERVPLNFRSSLKLGKIYNDYSMIDKSKVSEAERVLEKAIEVSPNNQQGYWNLAQTYLYQNKINEALLSAQAAVDLEPAVKRGHLILIQVASFTGNVETLREKINQALSINEEWATDITSVL